MQPPQLSYLARPDGSLAVYRWPGTSATAHPLVFIHATGFHARCWDAVVARLGAAPTGPIFALDLRGHGQSAKPAPPYAWRSIGDDVLALLVAQDLQNAVLVGHSWGGYTAALAAALAPERVAGLLLIDPTIFLRARYGRLWEGAEFVTRRRSYFASPEEMIARFAARPPFSLWDARVLHDYCTYGLLPSPTGAGYELACPPAIEAAVYAYSSAPDADIYDELSRLTMPTWVLRSIREPSHSGDFSASPTAPDLAQHLPNGRDMPLADHSHFIPMEDPALVARTTLALLESL